jgi:ketosteroid isomerase-like protein
MKKMIMTALMLFVASSFSVALSQDKSMGNKAELEKTVNTFFGFVKANDVDKIKTYYTADYTFTGPDGKMLSGDERLKMLKDGGGPTFDSASDIAVRTYGNTGVATGIATTKNASGGTQQSRFIQVWTWQGGQWRLAASQVTSIA